MLTWLACLVAPKLQDLTDVPAVELPDPSSHPQLLDRARQTWDEMRAIPWQPRADVDPYDTMLGLACRDIVTREADQHPDTAGRTPNYARHPAFEEVSVPGADGVTLTGRRSTGAPGAPVVIVVHGLYDSHVSFYVVELAEVLRRWGFHVLALDLRDHGRLRGRSPPCSMGLHEGRDLFAAASALSEAEGVSVGILGLSFGGHCAVRAAHEATKAGRPEVLRGGVLALSAPLDTQEAVAAIDDPSRLPRAKGLKRRLIVRNLQSTLRRYLLLRIREHGPFGHPVDDLETYIRDVVLPAYPKDPALVGSFLGTARSTQPEVLGHLAVPVAILHAADDPIVPVRHLRLAASLAKDNPFVLTRELPSGGHGGFGAFDPQATLRLIATFFGRLRDG
jgi:predicted alpha/beta-fold hydrolase